MAVSREKKAEVLKALKQAITDAKSLVFVNFHGLNVTDTTSVRKELRNSGVKYMVAKKTLAKKALSESKVEGETPELKGELGIAWSDDLIAPARAIYSFQKKMEEKISILGGIFEGVFKNKSEMTEIASIPPREVLLAQFVNVINSPIQGFVMALNELVKKQSSSQ